MTKRSIFAKIFLITFALFSSLVILLHASVYFIFPSTYIESQRQTILKKSEAKSTASNIAASYTCIMETNGWPFRSCSDGTRTKLIRAGCRRISDRKSVV